MTAARPPVLLTGASGFVGQRLAPVLLAAGHPLRCLSRDPAAARRRDPDRDWHRGDVNDEASLAPALDGCAAAFYLVHGMAEGAPDFRQREVAAALRFAAAARSAGTKRIVYLGGVAPRGEPSEHLRSRLEVGEALRASGVPTIELRASMIVGHRSLSWIIVRDLAARLPVMVLPRWLRSRTEPVAIDDIVVALVRALDVALPGSAWFDVPGPAALSGREILDLTTRQLGVHRPLMVEVPFVTPRLSSHWVRLVTRAEWSVARELVVGLTEDLLAVDDRYWDLIGQPVRIGFAEAAARAIAAERAEPPLAGFWGTVERLRRVGPGRG